MQEQDVTGSSGARGERLTRGVRSGGRSARVRRAVLDATMTSCCARGTRTCRSRASLLLPGVARSTIVRRWPTKDALLADAVNDVAGQASGDFGVPDLGCTRQELALLAKALVAAWGEPQVRESLRAMLAIPGEAMEQARANHKAERQRVLSEIVDRAVTRGELPADTDPLHLGDLLTAPLWMQIFMHDSAADDQLINRAVDDALIRFSTGQT